MRSRFALILAAIALVVLTGCARDGEREQTLSAWTLAASGNSAAIVLPAHVGDRVQRNATYTLTRAMEIDPAWSGRDLALVIPTLFAHVKLTVDGREIAQTNDSNLHAYRDAGPHLWRIPSRFVHDGAVMELAIEHTWTQSAWLDTAPRLTTELDGGRRFVLIGAFNDVSAAGALGFAIFAGYLYLVIFLSDRRRTEYGWFALTGLSGFAYPMFGMGFGAQFTGPFETLLLCSGVTTAVAAEIHFTADFFRLPKPSRLWDWAWIASCAAGVASLGYFTNTQVAAVGTIAFATPGILSQVFLFARLVRREKPPPDVYSVLGGWLVLSIVCVPDFNVWLGMGELLGGMRTACFGIFVIGLLQTATVSRAHMRSLRDAEVLNDELRRQIAARSRQLADALARLGAETGERALLAGEIIEGRYEVVRVLGAGAGGTVYLVERTTDRAKLAMKVVKGGKDAHALARLAREAQLAAEVKHAHVISIVDVDVAASGFLYVVMEYVAGETLREQQAHFGDLAWALPVLAQIADGLAVVHAHGVIHRDLKPANVLVVVGEDGKPRVKISDFGIARGQGNAPITVPPPAIASGLSTEKRQAATVKSTTTGDHDHDDDARLTEDGVLLGTPLYMAPEAIGGARAATPAVDVFAFGVIAYELVVGRLPFRDSPALVQLDGVNVAPPPPVLTERADCPADVAHVIDRCLSFEPEDRPTAREVAEILARSTIATG